MPIIKWGHLGGGFLAGQLRLEGNQRDNDASRRAMIDSGVGWTALHAIAWIASRSMELLDDVTAQMFMPLGLKVGNAEIASRVLRDTLKPPLYGMSFAQSLAALLSEVKRGTISGWTGPETTAWFGHLPITGLAYAARHVGFEVNGKPDPAWISVLLDADTIRSQWPAVAKADRTKTVERSQAKPRGRRPKWKWKEMIGELLRIADEDGLDAIGDTQADLERWALDWFMNHSPTHESPSESQIREHVAPVFQARDTYNRAKAEK